MTRKNTESPAAAPDADRFLAEMDRAFSGWDDPPARIMQALRRDEFALFAQPILSLEGEPRFGMAELLVRLREEEEAMLPPGEFFPVFEHFGMMPQLDRWVARRAIARLASGSRVPQFSINASAQTLVDGAFASDVAAELARTKLKAVVRVGDVIGVGVIAECVEGPEVLARVRNAGAGYAQGFGIRRPAPLDAVADGTA